MNETRFRAYQLEEKGSSFSYSFDKYFVLIEARFNDCNKCNVLYEMGLAGVERLSCLHITSWDEDHCKENELIDILDQLRPLNIEVPGYDPDSQCGKTCKKLVEEYSRLNLTNYAKIDCNYIFSLPRARAREKMDVLFSPLKEYGCHNDNSIVKLFRRGNFSVMSLGDCESAEIANRIIKSDIARSEVDVLILAHHGADNGFTTSDFISSINPRVAICSSNFGSQYDHPRQEVRDILYHNDPIIPLYTTKTGDVVIICPNSSRWATVRNFKSNSSELSSVGMFEVK